jgi:replication factor A2
MGGADDYSGAGPNKALMGVSPLAKKIYNLLKSETQDDAGMEMQHIASRLSLPTMDVARAGEELLNAGIIFTTMNEHTWAILEY